jgi:hypothetical protein
MTFVPGSAHAGRGIVWLARAGYAARGVVYLIVGFFAALAALGRADTMGSEGALRTILGQPFGRALVWLMIVGLAGFALWRVVQAVMDTDRHGRDAKGLAVRAGLVGSAVGYGSLALFALGLVTAWGGGRGDPSRGWIASIYEAGWGRALVWAVAAILFAVAAAHVWKGYRAGFEKYFRAPARTMRWLRPLSRFGLIARGVTFILIGILVLRGGLRYGSGGEGSGRPGLQDALQAVQGYPAGWLILLVIAVGLAAFGVYSLAEAVYRRVDRPPALA